MKKLFKKTILTAVGTALVLLPTLAFAQTGGPTDSNPFTRGVKQVGAIGARATGQTTQRPLPEILGSIINVFLGFLGMVFLLLMLYAGFLWMMAQGDDKQVTKAKDMIKQAVIGLIVIVAAFAISNFIVSQLANVASGTI